MSRDAKEGVVAISGDEKKTSIIEVNCETDFVAKNDDFINFVKELSDLNNQQNSNLDELKNPKIKFKEVKKALRIRNISDTKRKNSPLLRHRDSVEIDTGKLDKVAMLSKMTVNVERILKEKYGNRTRTKRK